MKIGIVSAIGGSSTEPFVMRGKEMGVEVGSLALADLILKVGEGKSKLSFGSELLEDYRVLLIRAIGMHLQELEVLLEYAKQRNIPVVDEGLYQVKLGSGSKAFTALRLREVGISYVPTLCFSDTVDLEMDVIGEPPWILKHSMGKQGNNLHVVLSSEEIIEKVKEKSGLWMLQPVIEAKGDYRVIVLGGKVLGVMHRTPGMKGEIRSNISVGGKGEKGVLDGNTLKMAVQAAEVCGWEFAGVDLLQDIQSKRWYVLEVNRAPQFGEFMKVTGVDVPKVVIEYLVKRGKK